MAGVIIEICGPSMSLVAINVNVLVLPARLVAIISAVLSLLAVMAILANEKAPDESVSIVPLCAPLTFTITLV